MQPAQQRQRALVIGQDDVGTGLADRGDQRTQSPQAVQAAVGGEPVDQFEGVRARPAGGDREARLGQRVRQPGRGEPAHRGEDHRAGQARHRPQAGRPLTRQREAVVDDAGDRGRRFRFLHHREVVAVDPLDVDLVGVPGPEPHGVAAEVPVDRRRDERHRSGVEPRPVPAERGVRPGTHLRLALHPGAQRVVGVGVAAQYPLHQPDAAQP